MPDFLIYIIIIPLRSDDRENTDLYLKTKARINALLAQLPCLTSCVVQYIQTDRKYNYRLQFQILQTPGKTRACEMLHLLHFFFSLSFSLFLALQDN